MPDCAHTANAFATDPLVGLLPAIALSFVLLILSERVWWIHGALGLLLLIVSIIFHDQRHLSFDSFLVALIAAVISAAGDRVQHVTPIDEQLVNRAFSVATIMRMN